MNFNLWEYLKPNNTTTQPLDISNSIQPMPGNQSLTNDLHNRIVNNNVKDLNSFQAGFNKLKNNFNLFDKIYQATPDTIQTGTNENGEPVLNSTIGNPIQKNGFLSDIQRGFNENYNNGFQLSNLQGDKNKSFANHLGELLGSAGRIAQSPLGRAGIVGGLVGLTGGNPLEMLVYGGQAGMLNQQNRLNDTLYRNQLSSQGIDTNDMRGYINSNTYNQLLNAKQMQDNSEYRNAMLGMQKQNHEDMVNLSRDKFNYQRERDKTNDYFKSKDLEIREKALGQKSQKLTNSQQAAIDKINQMNVILDLIDKNPNATGLWQSIDPTINKRDSKNGASANIETRTAIDKLHTAIRHELTGAQFSPQEKKEYYKFLPTIGDNVDEIKAKIKVLKRMYMTDPRLLGNLTSDDLSGLSNTADKSYENQNRTPKLAY